MLLRVEENLSDLAELGHDFFQTIFSGVGSQIAYVQPSSTRELFLGRLQWRQLVSGAVNSLQFLGDKVSISSAIPTPISSGSSATASLIPSTAT